MITPLKESFHENSESLWTSCCHRTIVSEFSSKRNVADNDSLQFLENRCIKTYQGGGGAKHKEDSWEEPLALLVCSSTTVRNNRLFATFHADRKSWFTISAVATRRSQSVGTHSIDSYCFIGHAFSCRWKCSKRQEVEKVEFEPWPQASKINSWRAANVQQKWI